ncbi:uncharacterized protein LOC114350639 [Ostrinia furnacalis]|uniref:uncharacterized protein LOC114350639 n=1 Tax=Ostrinia furnacalis TaxID=93504 RepID=UPI00103BE261|nr:uncharacterized protein LOC114350639 [Ostrinia furnacalis]
MNVRSFDNKNWFIRNAIYVIITEDFTELTEGLIELKNEMSWNPRAQFLISTKNVCDTEIQVLFEQFLTMKIYEVVFINYKNMEANVHTYRPFHDGNCGEYIEEIENLGSCSENNARGYFPKNITEGLKNCKFRALKYKYNSSFTYAHHDKLPIVEQFIIDTFAEFTNYTIQYKIVIANTQINYGIVLPHGNVTGLLGELYNNVADIAVGSTVIIKNRADVFDYVCGFKVATFKLFTSALGKEIWKTVYTEFDTKTWLLILLFYVIIVVACIMLLNMHPKIPYSHTYLIVKLWGFFYLGNGAEPYSKTRRLRSVTAFWIWFTFFISSFYNSDMYGLITGHVQRKRHIEPEQLASIPYQPCISTVISTFFIFAYNEKLPESLDIPACRTIDGAFDRVANAYDLYTVQLKESYVERQKDFIDKEGNRKLDIWDFYSDIVLGFYVTKGFPVRDKLQSYAQRMYETGLVENYLRILNPLRGVVDHRKKRLATPFVLDDFIVHFAVLFVGSILSTITFVAEIIYYRKQMNNSRNVLVTN